MERLCSHAVTMPLLAIFCCLLWGGATPVLKLGYLYLGVSTSDISSMILFAGVRFGSAGLLLILFYSATQKKPVVPKKREILPILSLCLCQTITQYILYYIGISHLTGMKSSVFQGSAAFFTIMLSCFVFRFERFSNRKLVSCLIGFSGIVIANLNGLDLHWRWVGEGAFLLANFFAGMSNCVSKKASEKVAVQTLIGYQFFVGGLVLTIVGFTTGGRLNLSSGGAVASLLYLAVAGAVAQTLWSELLKYNDASKIGIFTLLLPVFGVLFSAAILPGERLSGIIFLALILVCTGIALANYKKKTTCH